MTARLLTLAEVADRLPFSRATLYRMIARGELTIIRTPTGRVFVPESSIEEFVASCTVKGGHDEAMKRRAAIHVLPSSPRAPRATADTGEDLEELANRTFLR